MHQLAFFSSFSIVAWCLCPRLFLYMDKKMAHLHIVNSGLQPSHESSNDPGETPQVVNRTVRHRVQSASQFLPEYTQCLDSLVRATRSQEPARDALLASLLYLPPSPALTHVLDNLRNGKEIHISLSPSECSHFEERFFEFLRISLAQQAFIPQALEQAADLIREEFRHHQDITTATAQARSSASLLTFLPFIVLALLLNSSQSVRQGALTTPFVLTIAIGITINRIGWWWIQQMVHKSRMSTTDLSSSMAQRLCISLRAGVSLHVAIEAWAAESEPSLYQALLRGDSLSTALHDFIHRHSDESHHLVQILLEADRDGLPLVHTISQLSLEMRTHRNHQSDIKVRQLPTKLTLPIVLCVLPSFIFLTVIPIVLANISQFTLSSPPLPTIS
jgi:Flp pilus assembly protein TadB